MMSPNNGVVYVGVTSNLIKRAYEHRNKKIKGFTSKYNVIKLVKYEQYNSVYEAISREKQIKSGSRKKKIDLISTNNPKFIDLYDQIIG